MSKAPDILVRELGPREGFQLLSKIVPTTQKIALINALSQTGVREIEVTSFVRADRVPQMADAEELCRQLTPHKDLVFRGLALNIKAFERAILCPNLLQEGWIYSGASETFLKKNANTSAAEIINSLDSWCAAWKAHHVSCRGVMISNAFGCAYEGAITAQQVVKVLKPLLAGLATRGFMPKEVSLADTVGLGNPDSVTATIEAVRKEFSGLDVSLHLHDTQGLGIANCYAGLRAGVRIFESSIGGMGGCPFTKGAAGNVATEELVLLCESVGYSTGIDQIKLQAAAQLAESICELKLPSKLIRRV